ncbi:AsmA family protein [Desulfobacterales bacterium HSG16]|nr:AsmA family protein [Desulfobacterales bacterium HSG16]
MKTMKKILLIVSVLFIAVIAGIAFLVSTYDFNKFKPIATKAVFDATGRKLTITGDIEVALGFRPSLVLEHIKFENAKWGSRADLATLKRFDIQVALLPLLSGNVEIRRFIIDSPDILIELDEKGKSNLEFDVEKKKPEETQPEETGKDAIPLPEVNFKQLRIKNARVVFKDGKAKTMSAIFVDDFSLSGTLGDIIARNGMDLKLMVSGKLPEKFVQPLTQPLSFEKEFEVSSSFTSPAANKFSAQETKIVFDKNKINLSATVDISGKKPAAAVKVESEKIDLRPFLPEPEKPGKKTKRPGKKKSGRVFPRDPLPAEALNLADADITVRIAKILLPKIAMNDLKVDIALHDGQLEVKPVQAVIGGGKLDASVKLAAPRSKKDSKTAFSAALDISSLDVGQMLRDLEITDLFEGQLNVDVKLNSKGGSVAGLMAALNGHSKIIMNKALVYNGLLEFVGADLRASLFRIVNPFEEKRQATNINCFVNYFDFKKGIAQCSALVVDTDRLSLIGEGHINLRNERLDLSLKPSPKEGLGTKQVGKISISISELAKPFKLGGTLAKPALAIDTAEAAIALGKAAAGVALFGPVGIAAALADGNTGSKNPCLGAIDAAEKGVKYSQPNKTDQLKKVLNKTGSKVGQSIKDVGKDVGKDLGKGVKDVGNKLKGLFGN